MRVCTLVLAAALLLLGFPPPSHAGAAGVITVTTTVDEIAANDVCSLREAVLSANTDTAVGGCPAGNGADTITFAFPDYTWFELTRTGADEDAGQTGDLDLTGELTIVGASPFFTLISGFSSDRLFDIQAGAQVTLRNLGLHSGQAPVGEAGAILVRPSAALTVIYSWITAHTGTGIIDRGRLELSGGTVAQASGDGLWVDGGAAVVRNVSFLDNGAFAIKNTQQGALQIVDSEIAYNRGGVSNTNAQAALIGTTVRENYEAGIVNSGALPTVLTLAGCTVADHVLGGTRSGGGIANAGVGARATIATSAIVRNAVEATGGGIYNNGTLTVRDSLIAANAGSNGGGIDNAGGSLTLTNVTLSGNRAADNGGGLYNRTSAVLNFVTLAGNAAGGGGGGAALFNDEAAITFRASLVTGVTGQANCVNTAGFINSGGYNVEQGASCGFKAAGDANDTDPQLAPLADNGGPTQTHALPAGSPAIDRAPRVDCPATDQRGVARPQGAGCDSGAFEWRATPGTPLPLFLPLIVIR